MNVVLVHKKNKDAQVVATDPIQVTALETWGFVVSDKPFKPAKTDGNSDVVSNDEVEKLKKQLAEAQEKLAAESDARAKAEDEAAKAKSDADEALKAAVELEKESKKDSKDKESK